tara:strand:- start:1554 stop:2396 length:843 start_codon:yes stop_codon:yes gene_type:complete
MKYINFQKNEQISFMKCIKEKSQFKWQDIANFLKISRGMVLFYHNGHSKIPVNNYNKLCALAQIKPSKKDYIEIKNKTEEIRNIKKISNKLSELIGALAGDGHISGTNYEVSISGHLYLDADYIKNNITYLFEKLFNVNVKFKINKKQTNLRCVINSKRLVEYLIKEFKLPIGKKKGKLHIPIQIMNRNIFLKNYIKGLFDTDGSLYLKRKGSLVVSIISRDPTFLNEVNEGLTKLGYNPSVSGKNLYIYRQEQVRKFFKDIKPNNKKHLEKYDRFINII